VPLVNGEQIGYANLDHAASAPCLAAVRDAIDEFLPYYASGAPRCGIRLAGVHKVYERTREVLRRFVDARQSDTVIFTAHHRLVQPASRAACRSTPRSWCSTPSTTRPCCRGRARTSVASAPRAPALEAVSAVDRALADCPAGPRLVVLTGASNVTGELLPVKEIAAVAANTAHGSRSTPRSSPRTGRSRFAN